MNPREHIISLTDGSQDIAETFEATRASMEPQTAEHGAKATLDAPAPPFTGFELSFSVTSVELAARVGVSGIFTGAISAGEKALFFDALLTTDFYEETSDDGEVLFAKRLGTGVRVALRAQNLSSNMALNFAAVAAEASIKAAQVTYQVQGIGLSADVVKALLAVPLRGELGADAFAGIHHAIGVALPKHLRENTVTPGQYPAFPSIAGKRDPWRRSRSVNFAMTMISKQATLPRALERMTTSFDREAVVLVYSRVAGITDTASTAQPSREAAHRASFWFSRGTLV